VITTCSDRRENTVVEEQKILNWLDRLSRTKAMTAVEAIMALTGLSTEVGAAGIACIEIFFTVENELKERINELVSLGLCGRGGYRGRLVRAVQHGPS
jgi:hypothetical protein